MILPLQNFSTLLENMSAGLQGAAGQLIDLSVGSVMRALLETSASIALWMQWLIMQVLATTRASTSVAGDLDSWMADFSLARLPGTASVGLVTFGRYTIGIEATIPFGSLVRSSDGSATFAVIEVTSHPAWTVTGYKLAAASPSVDIPVQATVAGQNGNVLPDSLTILAAAISGVDYVTNAAPLTGGGNAESDDDLRTRFRVYINSRSQGTALAVGSAIRAVQNGVRYALLENVDLLGQNAPGNFCVFVDDGSGTASELLITQVSASIDEIRPLGSTFSVTPPNQISVAAQFTVLTSDSKIVSPDNIKQAVYSWISGLPMGGLLSISKLESIIHITDSSVTSIVSASVNNQSSDIQLPSGSVFSLVDVGVLVISP